MRSYSIRELSTRETFPQSGYTKNRREGLAPLGGDNRLISANSCLSLIKFYVQHKKRNNLQFLWAKKHLIDWLI